MKTTAIGSLPHPNVDSALAFAFGVDLPFLPQIPIRNPWEYMIPQALDGLPGLRVERDGSALLDLDVWNGRYRWLEERLDRAFSDMSSATAFSEFEPGPATSSCWQPFLWELEERAVSRAKIQIAGPLTSQWSIRTVQGSPLDPRPEVSTQVFRLVLARALGMTRRMRNQGTEPVLFLDEPGMFGLSRTHARHVLGMQELKLLIQTIKKEDVPVAIHCCSDTDWSWVLSSGIDLLSIDVSVSLPSLLGHAPALTGFLNGGGRLALGIVPSPKRPGDLEALSARGLLGDLERQITATSSLDTASRKAILSESLLTPACGLALHTPEEAENVLALLRELSQFHS